jgi:hypothetical protein
MSASRWRRIGRALPHHGCVALTLLSYLIATLGFPLPTSAAKIGEQPFPCQSHLCGCQCAEQCWQHCCCFTAEERWSWARLHNVEPPADAAKPAGLAWNTVRLRDQEDEPEADTASSCCAPQDSRPCCQKHSSRSSEKRGSILGVAACSCHGVATLWISVGAVLFRAPNNAWSPFSPFASRILSRNQIRWDLRFNPPTPPPRLFLA